ncbi:MAG: FTR1 family protein [Candidatus Dormibacteria bacterium]
MAASFLIFLREGVEGTMICAIVLSALAAAGRRDLYRWVLGGAAVAVVLSGLVGMALFAVARDAFVGSRAQTWFETGTFAVAVLVLTYMTFWMRHHSRQLSRDLQGRVAGAIAGGSGLALAGVAFATVGREALETAIFLTAIVLRTSGVTVLVGAALGLTVATGISVAVFRLGRRVPIARLFTTLGAGLMIVAAGLVANTVQNLQALHVLPGGGRALWDTGGVLPQDSTLGDTLHGLLGYASSPTALQVGAYALFVSVGLFAFLRRPGRPGARPSGRVPA